MLFVSIYVYEVYEIPDVVELLFVPDCGPFFFFFFFFCAGSDDKRLLIVKCNSLASYSTLYRIVVS